MTSYMETLLQSPEAIQNASGDGVVEVSLALVRETPESLACLSWVHRVTLAVCRSLPVFPD
jgi:hypothetical protein